LSFPFVQLYFGLGNSLQTAQGSAGGAASSPTRGVIVGGTSTAVMDYITIDTLGNATNFGNRTVAGSALLEGVNSQTRGCFAGGYPSSSNSNVIDYITIATPSNATDFGDLAAATRGVCGVTNQTRGCFAGGYSSLIENTISYITIDTTGNATDFGDLLTATYSARGCGDGTTRGIYNGAHSGGTEISYITIATTGNATDFGDFTANIGGNQPAGCVNSDVRAVFAGGSSSSIGMDYITIATPGNATNFGDLTLGSNSGMAGVNSITRGVFGGGSRPSGSNNTANEMDYITIATPGNATTFGDLTVGREGVSCCQDGL
jgi:hypothetical protein